MSGVLSKRAHPVAMDVHLYHMTTPLARFLPLSWYLRKIERGRKLLGKLSRDQSIIVGEWSGVLRGETVKDMSSTQREALTQQHLERQLSAYTDTAGWFYWNYKTEGSGLWNFRSLVESGKLEIGVNDH